MRHGAAPRPPRLRGALTCTLVVVAACGGSGFQYVENEEFSAYFKIDEDWAVYDEQEYFSTPGLDMEPLQRQRRSATTWLRAFDGSDAPSLANVLRDDAPAPHGVARIQLLTEVERESVNLAWLRSVHLGFDPVRVEREQPDGPVEIMRQEDLSLEGGQHGLRMVVAYDTPSGGVGVVDQTALLDGANSVLYLFVVGCSDRCYLDHQETLEEVVSSWTIEKR
ncbi:MAG: hypothetical protein M3N25_02085 [Actinomycetota bacterium]|nr:hypothetical protein [Actinomycetota bacterium]